MSKFTAEIPFTELVERALQMARVDERTNAAKARAVVNDLYCRILPSREDWRFLLVESALTCDAEYTTGTVTINTQETAAVFAGGAALTTAMVGRKIKLNSNPNVYTITARASTSDATLSPPLSGITNAAGDSFSIFQDTYALAGDFDRFPKNGGLLWYQGGRRTTIPEQRTQEFLGDFVPSPGTPQVCSIVESGTAGVRQVVLSPPPNTPFVFPYYYLRQLVPLQETSAGFVDIASGATAVVGSAGTTRFTEVATGAYVRITPFGVAEDSEWYRVLAIPHNSSATLGLAFGLSGATTAAYVLSDVPQMPAKLHLGILYGAVKMLVADQNDPTYKYYDQLEREVMTEARKQYKTRLYDQTVDTIATDWQYRR